MKKTIYHGSNNIIEKPKYGLGKKYNDYGQGFYCTYSIDMAKEWSVSMFNNGYANIYEIDLDGLNILDLNNDNYTMLHWLTVLLKNRTFDTNSILAVDAKEYLIKNFDVSFENVDIVLGYRADDSYFSYAQDFLNGAISYRQLCNAMRLGKLGEQFVLISEKAFNSIKYLGFETAEHGEWFSKKMKRDTYARHDYFNTEKNRRLKDDIYITNILNEEIKHNDPRLR